MGEYVYVSGNILNHKTEGGYLIQEKQDKEGSWEF